MSSSAKLPSGKLDSLVAKGEAVSTVWLYFDFSRQDVYCQEMFSVRKGDISNMLHLKSTTIFLKVTFA